MAKWTTHLGECADAKCGCYRLGRPDVRHRFREFVCERTAEELRGRGGVVRYVTVGSGQLLTDWEILSGLERRGLTIESIVAVDKAYVPPGAAVLCRRRGERRGGRPLRDGPRRPPDAVGV